MAGRIRMQYWDLYENVPEIPPGEGGQNVDYVSDAQNSSADLVSQLSLATGGDDEIELLMNLVGKIEIQDTEENRIALAEAYKGGWREGTTRQRLAELVAIKKADRKAALEATLGLDISRLLGGVLLVVR